MLIDMMGPGCGGTLTPAGTHLIETQKMTRFILRNVVKATADPCDGSVTPGRNGYVVTPLQMAEFTNAVQALAESQRLGIPVRSRTTHGVTTTPIRASAFHRRKRVHRIPEGGWRCRRGSRRRGHVAVKALAEVMSGEWRVMACGACTVTRPTWRRAPLVPRSGDFHQRRRPQREDHEDAGPAAARRTGEPSDRGGADDQALSGGGPQELGSIRTTRSASGRSIQAQASGPPKPFKAAIDAGASSIMPYLGRAGWRHLSGHDVRLDGLCVSRRSSPNCTRQARVIGYVISDPGIISDRAWGLERRT